jgi:tellurite resistance protein TehA-like permease
LERRKLRVARSSVVKWRDAVTTAIAELPPGSFAFVMATGIASTATHWFGPPWISRALLVAACVGVGLLGALLVARFVWFPEQLVADLRRPERVFGFFTVVAGLDVVGVRLDFAGHPLATAILAMVAGASWFALTYGVPASLLLARESESVLEGINGTWLLWVVATQSLAIASAALVATWPKQANLLAGFAAGLWGVGLILYLVLVAMIMLRWLTVRVSPGALGPPYWILMGATAITVLGGARILALDPSIPVRAAMAGTVEGFSFVLWSFGSWWVPLLVVLGVWRHVGRRWPLAYETGLWSVVFPLGMYSVATLQYGKVAHLGFMHPIAHVMMWVAVAAWLAVAVGGVVAVARRVTRHPVEVGERARGVIGA